MGRLIRGVTALTLALWAGAAGAHPHIFIDARVVIAFDGQGAISSLRNVWAFDEAFSAYYTQGLDTDGDGVTSPAEMQELADQNIADLGQYGFYVSAGEGQDSLSFTGSDARLEMVNGRAELTFTLTPPEPYRIHDRFEIAIADPEYYVAINLDAHGSITLDNAPAGCAATLAPPRDLPDEIWDRLYALPADVTTLPPDLAAALRGAQGAIVIDCAGAGSEADTTSAAPATALDATQTLAESRPMPFGGPPPEPGLAIPQSGPLRWIADRQNEFYSALVSAMSRLKEDGSAAFLLGLLSFLYGIFHAAGPGHGKVVISSYMLATERQLRRGIALSFAAALLQSLVAIGLVGIAAALLRLSTAALNDATHWIGVGSYALLAALGLWLVVRRLFGLGHHHHHPDLAATAHASLHAHSDGDDDHHHEDPHHQHDGHGHDHAHDHDDHHDGHDHHHHAVLADQTGGTWREGLGVVLAAGLRPCSGALIVLVFALSQDIFPAGIVATLLMGLGTGITVAILASLAVSAKGLMLRLAGGGNSALGGTLLYWAEMAGALLIFALGVLLLVASF